MRCGTQFRGSNWPILDLQTNPVVFPLCLIINPDTSASDCIPCEIGRANEKQFSRCVQPHIDIGICRYGAILYVNSIFGLGTRVFGRYYYCQPDCFVCLLRQMSLPGRCLQPCFSGKADTTAAGEKTGTLCNCRLFLDGDRADGSIRFSDTLAVAEQNIIFWIRVTAYHRSCRNSIFSMPHLQQCELPHVFNIWTKYPLRHILIHIDYKMIQMNIWHFICRTSKNWIWPMDCPITINKHRGNHHENIRTF